jgi:hypothetical protein
VRGQKCQGRAGLHENRGSELNRVFKLHQARKNYFLNRVNKDWNELPMEALSATSVDDFKKKLDRFKQFQFGCLDLNFVPVVKTRTLVSGHTYYVSQL